ncbi:histidine kinase [Burkholderia diffusa]|uniref:histidine kinase n=1 Tax=Burkholderia diffusa TaxID=488732 RepID=A0AAW3PDG6_9BURK|nr:quorum system sensor histidine kinase RqpS [Burkholderia diffusa]KUZ04829.1 histidine kinase [Burkholderia diffusa]KVC20999.1 histidine kinase [Burkholderia diffusa]KWF31131.1 histidine kinase [Burkholderia diffusa]KWF35963.1 histidine kinase [Burkholderia diffusa]KWF45324.1 histidine kinase [Burkholderia diffusa]
MDTSLNAPTGAHAPFPSQPLVHGCDAAAPAAETLPERDTSAARIAALSLQLMAADEAARRHLAGELHDGLGAELTAARFALANIQTWLPADAPDGCLRALELAQQALDSATDANRRLIDERDTPALDGGVVGALSAWVGSHTARTGLRTSFVCAADARLTQLGGAGALAIFRVAQEALSNVAKHARATSVDVRIDTDDSHMSLIVTDDGTGFARSRRTGYGLAGMRARCEAFGGTFDASAPEAGRGTRVTARFAWDSLFAVPAAARRASLS